jgi:aminoglycoside phosphotransferase (APT) family kinase protein
VTDPAAVTDYVGSVIPDCRPDRVVATTRYPRGENHAVYRVSYLDRSGVQQDVVVRVSNSSSVADRAKAEREAAVLVRLRGRASPRLLDFRARGPVNGAPVMCLEHVSGSFQPLEAVSGDRLAQLGALVRRTHEVPVHDLVDVLKGAPDLVRYVADRLHSMLGRMPLVRDPLPASMQAQFAAAAAWARTTADLLISVDDPGPPSLLHGDVSAGNVLWTPQPVLIDWEYARLGDPADEIGYLFGQNALRQEQREGFWRGYTKGLDPASRARVVERSARWEPLTLFGSALYWIELWSRRTHADVAGLSDQAAPRESSYYLHFARRYVDRCDELRHAKG